MQKFKCKGQEKIGGRNHPLKVFPMQGRSGEKIAARTERTTRKPRIGHAIAAITRVRGSRKVCGAKLASRVLLCGALFRLRLLRGGDGG